MFSQNKFKILRKDILYYIDCCAEETTFLFEKIWMQEGRGDEI